MVRGRESSDLRHQHFRYREEAYTSQGHQIGGGGVRRVRGVLGPQSRDVVVVELVGVASSLQLLLRPHSKPRPLLRKLGHEPRDLRLLVGQLPQGFPEGPLLQIQGPGCRRPRRSMGSRLRDSQVTGDRESSRDVDFTNHGGHPIPRSFAKQRQEIIGVHRKVLLPGYGGQQQLSLKIGNAKGHHHHRHRKCATTEMDSKVVYFFTTHNIDQVLVVYSYQYRWVNIFPAPLFHLRVAASYTPNKQYDVLCAKY